MVFLVVCFVGLVSAETYYVATYGDDLNDGLSVDSPWASVSKAWNDAEENSIVYYLGGNYNIYSTISVSNGRQNIAHMNYNDEEVVWNSLVPTTDSVIEVKESYITVDGITVIASIEGGDDGFFELDYDVNNFVLRNCVGIQNSFSGTQGGDVGNTGIVIGLQSPGTLIENCVFRGPGGEVGGANSAGVIFFKGQDWIIRNNEFYDFYTCLFYNKHPNDPLYDNGVIENNYFHDCHTALRTSANDVSITNNIFDGNVYFGYDGGCNDLISPRDCGSDRNNFNHNTINGLLEMSYTTRSGDRLPGANENIFRNNIFTRKANIYAYYSQEHNSIMDYNLYALGDIVMEDRINYNLNEWILHHSQDSHSFSAEPIFVGGSNPQSIEGFELASNSPGHLAASDSRDMGVDVSLVGPGFSSEYFDESYCGDLTCDLDETCSSCPSDCPFPSCPNCDDSNSCTVDSCVGENTCSPSCSNVLIEGCEEDPIYDSSGECLNWRVSHPEWIWCDSFDDSALMSDKYFEYNDNEGDFVVLEDDYFSAPSSIRALYQEGEVDAGNFKKSFGRTPSSYFANNAERGGEDFDEVYWRMYVKMEDSWIGSPAKFSRATIMADSDWSQAMIAHLWSDGDYLKMDPTSGVDGDSLVTVGYNDFDNLDWLGARSGVTPLFSNAEAGGWRCVEAHVALNSAGNSDGVFEFWIDGNLEASRNDLDWVGSWGEYGINSIFVSNYWNSGSPQEQARYIDNFVISTERIGCFDDEDLVDSTCNTDSDLDCDGVVSMNELALYINRWKAGEVSMGDLVLAVGEWSG